MKNITVTVEDALHRRARIRAAEQETTVTAVVRDFLTSFSQGETDFERLKRLESETLATVQDFSASDRLCRDELHDRHAFR